MKSPSIEEIIADPMGAVLPTTVSQRAILALELAKVATKENLEAILKYTSRPEFTPELDFIVMMESSKRDHALTETQAFIDWAHRNSSMFTF